MQFWCKWVEVSPTSSSSFQADKASQTKSRPVISAHLSVLSPRIWTTTDVSTRMHDHGQLVVESESARASREDDWGSKAFQRTSRILICALCCLHDRWFQCSYSCFIFMTRSILKFLYIRFLWSVKTMRSVDLVECFWTLWELHRWIGVPSLSFCIVLLCTLHFSGIECN